MKKSIIVIIMGWIISGNAQAVEIDASCGCEHFATQYDQFCEATPFDAPVSEPYRYRYIWSATDPNVILSPEISTSPSTVASCVSGSGCEVKLSVRVEAVDSFYYPFQNICIWQRHGIMYQWHAQPRRRIILTD